MSTGYYRSKEYQVLYDKAHPEKYLWKNARNRARLSGVDFEIEIDDIIIPEVCPVFGTKLLEVRQEGFQNESPSLDRIDNEKGYTKNNIQVISWRANKLKSQLTVDEIMKLAEYVSQARRS